MMNYLLKIAAAVCVALSASSCCSVCTKGVTATPTVEDGKDTSKKSVAIGIEFEQCRDSSICRSTKALNKQMDQQTKWFETGKITWEQYREAKDKYYAALADLAKQGTVTGGQLPVVTEKSGRSGTEKKLVFYREDFNSSTAFDMATAAKIENTAATLSNSEPAKPAAR